MPRDTNFHGSPDMEIVIVESHVDEVTTNLSSRVGKLQVAEDGQLRYYGATSNLHILHNGPNSLSQPSIRTIQAHGKHAIAQANLEWPGDHEYEEHLLDLFFAWHNPFTNVVDKSCYYRSRQAHANGHNATFYSLCLTNAMYVYLIVFLCLFWSFLILISRLAIGCAYGPRVHSLLPDNSSEFFSSRAKVFLDIEMDSPTVATIQALLILASHEAAQIRDSRGNSCNTIYPQLY
jgi:hypothetical protein